MANSKGFGLQRLRAVEGKGFYIVLFLCAAVIGLSVWALLTDAGTHVEELNETAAMAEDTEVVTVLPAGLILEDDAQEPETDEAAETFAAQDAEVIGGAVVQYVWPVWGGVEVPYAVEALRYDATMADWRTHDGVDIACSVGDEVAATAAGLVTAVYADDLLGTTVEIDHQNGVHSVYANLAPTPAVSAGDLVSMGQTIGAVGTTALAETNEVPHLHFAMTLDGRSVSPMDYLPDMTVE